MSRTLLDYKITPPYTRNYGEFNKFVALHRKHQIEAIAATNGATIGQIISPCGTGKTRIQTSIIISDMISCTESGTYGKFMIASHRLALNTQLADVLLKQAIVCGLPFDILFVGSGRLFTW